MLSAERYRMSLKAHARQIILTNQGRIITMKYRLSRFTKIVSQDEQGITIIYNTFNGNQSYIYDKKNIGAVKAIGKRFG